jgi:modulator of FtsH protease HflK
VTRGTTRLIGLGVGVALFGLWLSTGVWAVRQNEQGVILRFGHFVRKVPSGMHWTLPYPAETLIRVGTTEVRTMPVGFKLVDQLRSVPPTEEEVQWVTGDTNIVEVQTVVQYRVNDAVQYLFRVAEMSDGRPRDFVLRALAESALTAVLGHLTVDDLLSGGKAEIQDECRRRTQDLADAMGLGLGVVSVNIVKVNPPAAVIAAFNDVSSAKADRERSMTEADGFAKDLLPKARAQANRLVQEGEIYRSGVVNAARGAAEAFLAMAAQVRLAPAVSKRRLWLEAVERALGQAKLVVYARTPGEKFHLVEREK